MNQVILDSTNPTSKKLYKSVSSPTILKVDITQIYSVKISGSTDYGTMTVRFLNGVTVLQTNTRSLTGTATDYSFTYSGTSVDRVEMYCSASVTGAQKTRIQFDGQLKVYVGTPSNVFGLFWIGWVQPDRLSRKFLTSSYDVSISATDGLNDLKQIDYSPINNFQKQINSIFDAIDVSELDLPIRSQINLSANGKSGSTLSNIYSNTKRFRKVEKDGKTKYTNCNDAISWILEPYTARLSQSLGTWTLTNLNETNSKQSLYYDPSSANTKSYNRTVVVSGSSLLFDSDELSKIRPNKQLNISFYNRNEPDNVVPNSDFSNGITGWSNGTSPNNFYSFSVLSEELRAVVTPPPLSSNPNITHYFTSSNFSLTYVSGATATVSIHANLNYVAYSANTLYYDRPFIKVSLYRNGSTLLGYDQWRMDLGYKYYTTTIAIPATDNDYFLKVEVIPDSSVKYTTIDTRYDEITVVANFSNPVFDKYYIATNTGTTAINILEKSLYFLDTTNQTDVGVLKINSSTGLTTTWSNYGGTENLPLLNLYSINKLKMASKFKDYLHLTFFRNDINIDSVLPIKGKSYYPASLSHDLGRNQITVDLIELLSTPIGITIQPTTLSSIDGDL